MTLLMATMASEVRALVRDLWFSGGRKGWWLKGSYFSFILSFSPSEAVTESLMDRTSPLHLHLLFFTSGQSTALRAAWEISTRQAPDRLEHWRQHQQLPETQAHCKMISGPKGQPSQWNIAPSRPPWPLDPHLILHKQERIFHNSFDLKVRTFFLTPNFKSFC